MARTNVEPRKWTQEVAEKYTKTVEYDLFYPYQNVAKHAVFGMHNNWHNNLVPDNVVNQIASYESVEDGLAEAAYDTLENVLNHRYFDGVEYDENQKEEWFVGIVQELAQRDGKGALGEKYFAKKVDERVLPPRESDENKGIDVRTKNATFQVKTGEKLKSSWDKKKADHLVWVKVEENEIVDFEVDPRE